MFIDPSVVALFSTCRAVVHLGLIIDWFGPGDKSKAVTCAVAGAKSWKKHGAVIEETLQRSDGNKYPLKFI